MISTIPSSLPILPLNGYVLLPSIVTTFMVCQSEADFLLSSSSDYVICIPLASKQTKTSSTDLSQLFHYGCVAKVIECDRTLPENCVLKVEGICRSRIRDISSDNGGDQFQALVEHYPNDENKGLQLEDRLGFQALVNTFIEKMRYIGVSSSVLNELSEVADRCHVSYVANLLLCITDSPFCDKLRVLELSDMKKRLEQVNHAVNRYLQVNTVTGISIYA